MRTRMEPGPNHPIAITLASAALRVTAGGKTIAASTSYHSLAEASYPEVAYIPRADADMDSLERSELTSWCPFKGEANYYHILQADGARIENAVWTYEAPFPAVAEIKDCLAFYPNKVSIETS